MNDSTLVAITILFGVFLLMGLTIWRSGVQDAIKVWNVMGALTGVAFGAITTFYFTSSSNQRELNSYEQQVRSLKNQVGHYEKNNALLVGQIKNNSGYGMFTEDRFNHEAEVMVEFPIASPVNSTDDWKGPPYSLHDTALLEKDVEQIHAKSSG